MPVKILITFEYQPRVDIAGHLIARFANVIFLPTVLLHQTTCENAGRFGLGLISPAIGGQMEQLADFPLDRVCIQNWGRLFPVCRRFAVFGRAR